MKIYRKSGKCAVTLITDERHIGLIMPEIASRLKRGEYHGVTYKANREDEYATIRVPYADGAPWQRKVNHEQAIADIELATKRVLQEKQKEKEKKRGRDED